MVVNRDEEDMQCFFRQLNSNTVCQLVTSDNQSARPIQPEFPWDVLSPVGPEEHRLKYYGPTRGRPGRS